MEDGGGGGYGGSSPVRSLHSPDTDGQDPQYAQRAEGGGQATA